MKTESQANGACLCGAVEFEEMADSSAFVPIEALWFMDGGPGRARDAHLFVESKATWDFITDSLPKHVAGRGSTLKQQEN